MPSEVNLIPVKVIKEQQLAETKFILDMVSIFSLVIIGFVISALFLYRTILTNQLTDIDKKLAETVSKIEASRDLEGSIISLQQKFKVYQQYADINLSRPQVWSQLKSSLPPTSVFQKLDIDENNKITTSISVPSYAEAASFLQTLQDHGFSQIKITSVAKDVSKGILVAVTFVSSGVQPKN